MRKRLFDVRVDTAFDEVMRACAAPRRGRRDTWINNDILRAYTELHGLGFASVGHQPARSLGNGEQQQDEDRRRRGHHAEHPAPSGLFGDDLADDEVAQVGEQDAEHDIELDEAD